MKMWQVISSVDGQTVFGKHTVSWEAATHNVTPSTAAKRLAKANEDPETDERLIAVPVT